MAWQQQIGAGEEVGGDWRREMSGSTRSDMHPDAWDWDGEWREVCICVLRAVGAFGLTRAYKRQLVR